MYSVLIVDDEKIVKLAIKSMINWENSGFELMGTASDGVQALHICEKKKPDLIITDLKMPHMDGIELIKRLKEISFAGEILVLSNYNDFELVREAMKYGAYDYILKVTVQSDDFMRVLNEIKEKLDTKNENVSNSLINKKSIELERYEFFKNLLMSNDDGSSRTLSDSVISNNDCMIVFIVTCRDVSSIKKTGQKIGEIFGNIAENVFNEYNWQCTLDYDNKASFIAIHLKRESVKMAEREMAERINELAGLYFNLRLSIVYSSFAHDGSSLFNEVENCKKSYELIFYKNYNEACIANTLMPSDDEKGVREAAARATDRIFSSVVSEDIDGIADSIEEIIREGEKNRLNPYRLKKIIKKSLRDLEKRLISNGICNDGMLDEYSSDEDTIFTASTEIKLVETLAALFRDLLEKTKSKRIYRKEVFEALKYIEDNIYRKISVPEIAKVVNLTDTYLCKVFKSDIGKSIIDYINELKMKKAYELIESSDYLIKEAAAAVGIDDQFYFNRLFKKYFGITPKEIKHRA